MLEWLADEIWSPWLLSGFLLVGLYLSVGSGFFQLFGLKFWLQGTIGSLFGSKGEKRGGISSWKALCTALASTIGTGSIAGVATAIWMGGPGAVFWMWVSALLGMMTGFVEKTLAVMFRERGKDGGWQGGPMYYIRTGMGSGILAGIYSMACLAAGFAGGNLVQSNAIATCLSDVFGWNRFLIGIVTALAAGAVMAGGLERISGVSAGMVPIMALLYLGGGGVVLLARAEYLLPAMRMILLGALCPQALCGGAAGYSVQSAMRYGVARGVFTNEAGLGSAAIAHAAADVDRPGKQGLWGIFEVGVSTMLVCTVTALVILVSGVYLPGGEGEGGASSTAAAFSVVLGPAGEVLVAGSLLLFAFSSILGWSFYGAQCLEWFCRGKWVMRLYRLAFVLTVAMGSVWDGRQVWVLVDLCNGVMAVPNLLAVLILSPQALRELALCQRKNF